MADSKKASPTAAEKNADHPQVDEILEALPQAAQDLGKDKILAAMPSDKEQLESEGNKHYQQAVGSLPEEEKVAAVAEIVKNNLGATADPEVQKRLDAEAKKRAESTDRPGDLLPDLDLPYGWAVTAVREPSSRQYGPDVVRTIEGHYEASKRVNGSFVTQAATTVEGLETAVNEWERIQAPGGGVHTI